MGRLICQNLQLPKHTPIDAGRGWISGGKEGEFFQVRCTCMELHAEQSKRGRHRHHIGLSKTFQLMPAGGQMTPLSPSLSLSLLTLDTPSLFLSVCLYYGQCVCVGGGGGYTCSQSIAYPFNRALWNLSSASPRASQVLLLPATKTREKSINEYRSSNLQQMLPCEPTCPKNTIAVNDVIYKINRLIP